MGMTIDEIMADEAYADWAQEQYEQEIIDNALKEISEENVISYLEKCGDAVQERIDLCFKQAEELINTGYYGSSLVLSATSIELIIRFLLLRPLVQGAFLSDEWADILSKRIATGRTAEDKDLLPAVLRKWDIDITNYTISTGGNLWENIRNKIWPKRNAIVHRASLVNKTDSLIALESANTLMKIVIEISKKLGFSIDKTGKWS